MCIITFLKCSFSRSIFQCSSFSVLFSCFTNVFEIDVGMVMQSPTPLPPKKKILPKIVIELSSRASYIGLHDHVFCHIAVGVNMFFLLQTRCNIYPFHFSLLQLFTFRKSPCRRFAMLQSRLSPGVQQHIGTHLYSAATYVQYTKVTGCTLTAILIRDLIR